MYVCIYIYIYYNIPTVLHTCTQYVHAYGRKAGHTVKLFVLYINYLDDGIMILSKNSNFRDDTKFRERFEDAAVRLVTLLTNKLTAFT